MLRLNGSSGVSLESCMAGGDREGVVHPRDLLEWISKQTNSDEVEGFADLQDGEVLLEMVQLVWPDLSPLGTTCDAWEGISRIANAADVPAGLLDGGARWSKSDRADLNDKGFASAIYNTLAALYFLWSLCQCHDFTAKFEIPINSQVAKFLQSDGSVKSLIKGGGLAAEVPEAVQREEEDVADVPPSDVAKPVREESSRASPSVASPPRQAGAEPKGTKPQKREVVAPRLKEVQRGRKESTPAQSEKMAESTPTSAFQWSSGADAAERGETIIHRLRSEVKRLQRQLEMERESFAAMEELGKRKLVEQELRFAHEMELLKEGHSAALWEAESGLAEDAALKSRVLKEQAGAFRDRSPTLKEYAALVEALSRTETAMRKHNERMRALEDERLQLGDRVVRALTGHRSSAAPQSVQELHEAVTAGIDRKRSSKSLSSIDRDILINLEKLINRLEEEKILLERRSRDAEAQWTAGDVSDQTSELSAIGFGNMSLFAGDSSTAASVCGDAEAMERSFRIEKECEELRATTSYLKQRLKLLEGSESSKEHTTEDEAQLVGFLRRLRADGFESSRMLLLLFWKIVGSAIRARKEAGLATAEAATARDRLQELEAAKNELAHTHAHEIDTLKKRHRRELRKISEEMMTNNSEAELRKEIAEMAVRGRDAEIARLRNDMARQWKRCWATDTERFESLWDDAQALRIQNEVLVIRDRLWKDLVKETSSDQKNEHRVKQLWAKLSAADRRISDPSATLEQKQLLQKAVEDRVRVYESRIAELERAQLGDELNPQAVAELQERVVKVESVKSKLERDNGSLEVELRSKTEELSRIQQEKEQTTTAMREALEAADQERARLRTELDIYHEQLCANDALRELLVMAKVEPIEPIGSATAQT
ncbi:hypothetical protein FOZ60_002506 [Perkinsus olseni]|uniref:Uncharacterized protein n=1 Tax=Perkinsus olseni TaxID=32597 RepID=A0A7J6NYV7_PEROL|nr:hypothetical protein FOZ60_002506 [Perkinsus olseni]